MRLLTVMLFSLLAFTAQASNLTEKDVQLWLKHGPALQSWLDQHEDKLPEEDMSADFSFEAALKQGIQQMKDAGIYNDFNRQVKSFGYRDVEHWSRITHKVFLAYTATMLDQQPDNRTLVENQLQSIRASKNIPAEEKAMLESMLQASLQMLKEVESVPAADKRAIAPYLQDIARQLGDTDEE